MDQAEAAWRKPTSIYTYQANNLYIMPNQPPACSTTQTKINLHIDRYIILFSLGYILSYTTIFIHTPYTDHSYLGYIYIHMYKD